MDYSVNLNKQQIEAVLNKYIAYDLDFDFELEYQNVFDVDNYTDNDVEVFKIRTISELASKIAEGQDPNLFLETEDHIISSFYNTTNGMRLSDISDEGLLFVNYVRRLYGETEEEEEEIDGGKKSNRSKKSQKERKVQKSRKERKVKSKKSRKAKKTRKSRK